ncbi:MAG: FeS-binding protein, partial [Maribacter sp.]
MSNFDRSMSLAGEPPKALNLGQKIGVLVGMTGLGILILQLFNLNLGNNALWLTLSLVAITLGVVLFSRAAYAHKLEGIKNDGVWFKSISSRGVLAWMAGLGLTGFYIVLYFYPQYLGLV